MNIIKRGLAVLFVALVISSCEKDVPILEDSIAAAQFSSEVPLAWNELYLEIERYTPGYRPPVSARTLGYLGLAAYECVQPGMADEYNSLQSSFPGLVIPAPEAGLAYHWPLALTATYERMFELMMPEAPAEHLFRIYSLRTDFFLRFQQEVETSTFSRSISYGTAVADAVYEWSATDGVGHEAYRRNTDPSYVPPSGPGLWQPTFPDFQAPLLPRWGEVRTFAADGSEVCDPPLIYDENPSSAIYQEAVEVIEQSAIAKQNPASEQRWIGDFWSDDCPILTFTPASRWVAVANQLVEQQSPALPRALEAYAKIGFALADAGVRSWAEKYRFNYQRPIDYIRNVMGVSDWNTVMCPDGSGLYFTPNFPAYPSGHATFGAASAVVLADIFGDNTGMTDRCHEGRTEFTGTPRDFNDFYEMAEENGVSRIYLGVHFRMDSDAGLDLGYEIGEKVLSLPWK